MDFSKLGSGKTLEDMARIAKIKLETPSSTEQLEKFRVTGSDKSADKATEKMLEYAVNGKATHLNIDHPAEPKKNFGVTNYVISGIAYRPIPTSSETNYVEDQ